MIYPLILISSGTLHSKTRFMTTRIEDEWKILTPGVSCIERNSIQLGPVQGMQEGGTEDLEEARPTVVWELVGEFH